MILILVGRPSHGTRFSRALPRSHPRPSHHEAHKTQIGQAFRKFQYPTPPLRIADRTVADEYFAVSEKVEALYDAPRQLPADAEGTEMAKLRREMHRRMLGNGYCARAVELDCHFESICESCTFFVTTIEFRPALERQRDDAAAKGQVAREQVFDGLLSRLGGEASCLAHST